MNDFNGETLIGSISSPVSLEELSTLCHIFGQNLNKFESQLVERNLLNRENGTDLKIDDNVAKSKEKLIVEAKNLKEIIQENKSMYVSGRDEKQFQKIKSHFDDLYITHGKLMQISQNRPIFHKAIPSIPSGISNQSNQGADQGDQSLEQVLKKDQGISTSDYQRIQLEKRIQMDKQETLQRLQHEMDELSTCYTDLDHVLGEQQEALIPASQNVERAAGYMEEGVSHIQAVRKTQKWNHCKIYLFSLCIFLSMLSIGIILFFIFMPKSPPPIVSP
jgi:hypothetical protein